MIEGDGVDQRQAEDILLKMTGFLGIPAAPGKVIKPGDGRTDWRTGGCVCCYLDVVRHVPALLQRGV